MALSDIAKARKQRVFAVAEVTRGTMVFPADTDFIRPAGNAVMNQVPSFAESEELADSLDMFDTFQNATPAGDWSVPMYCRPSGTLGSVPQGDAMFESFMGAKQGATTGELTAGINDSVQTFSIDTLSTGAKFPARGVVRIGTEDIYYGSWSGTTTITFASCTRGYGGSTAASHLEDDEVTLKSVFYKQAVTSPSFSLWIENDFFVQGMSGCSVTALSLGVNNEGAVTLNFSGQGMAMVWAGESLLDDTSSSGQKVITLPTGYAKRYSVGGYVYLELAEGTEYNNSGDGYEITDVDYDNDTITVDTNLEAQVDSGDYVKGYLPSASVIGYAIESRKTTVELDGVAGKFRSTDWTFNVPKQYLIDEIGTTEPEDYLEDKRDISSSFNVYFRKTDIRYFRDGYTGNEVAVELVFGDTATKKMAIYMKRCKLQMPNIQIEAPAIALNMGLRVLGTSGEDSVEIRFE